MSQVEQWQRYIEKLLQTNNAILAEVNNKLPVGPRRAAEPVVVGMCVLARTLSNVKVVLKLVRDGDVVEARTITRRALCKPRGSNGAISVHSSSVRSNRVLMIHLSGP